MPEKLDFKNAASTASILASDGAGLYLIKRKHEPFKGMWALPGGFHNCDKETLEETAIRELFEETSLIVEKENLFITAVNSEPDRDPRGHVIDHVFIALEYHGRPEAKDDAAELKYFEFNNLPELAFDHLKSINILLKQLGLFKLIKEKINKGA